MTADRRTRIMNGVLSFHVLTPDDQLAGVRTVTLSPNRIKLFNIIRVKLLFIIHGGGNRVPDGAGGRSNDFRNTTADVI